MNLGKLIDSLLRRHTSVYVKGLGVFKRVYTPATFDSKRNVFLPPISLIEFDHFETEGYDFLTYLQQLEHVDAMEAQLKLDNNIAVLMDRIHQNGEAVLENLGTLVSYGNSFVFKPLDLSGFLYTAVNDEHKDLNSPANTIDPMIGQDVASDDELVAAPIPTFIPTAVDHDPEVINATSIVKEEEEQAVASEDEEILQVEENIPAKRSNAAVFGLVAIIAIFILGGIYYYSTFQPYNPLVEEAKIVEMPVLDTISSTADSLDPFSVVEVDSSSIITKDSVPDVVKQEKIIDNKYIIIIGTHPTLEQANEQAESFNKKGHKTVRVLEPNMSKNKKRVIWDTYPTREQRDSAMREVRKLYKQDAWGSEI